MTYLAGEKTALKPDPLYINKFGQYTSKLIQGQIHSFGEKIFVFFYEKNIEVFEKKTFLFKK